MSPRRHAKGADAQCCVCISYRGESESWDLRWRPLRIVEPSSYSCLVCRAQEALWRGGCGVEQREGADRHKGSSWRCREAERLGGSALRVSRWGSVGRQRCKLAEESYDVSCYMCFQSRPVAAVAAGREGLFFFCLPAGPSHVAGQPAVAHGPVVRQQIKLASQAVQGQPVPAPSAVLHARGSCRIAGLGRVQDQGVLVQRR